MGEAWYPETRAGPDRGGIEAERDGQKERETEMEVSVRRTFWKYEARTVYDIIW